MAESPMSLSGLSLWLSEDDITCSDPLPMPPAPSRKPTKSLNHFISSGCCNKRRLSTVLFLDLSVSMLLPC